MSAPTILSASALQGVDHASWQGKLNLSIERRGDYSRLIRNRHIGPIMVQRPFYPERQVCHVYMIHPPGGVVGGDILEIDVECRERAQCLVTTPAAGKFYRSNGNIATQTVKLTVEDNSHLEWLPQETIFFDGARVRCHTQIRLQKTSRFMAWEFINLGRPACGERFDNGFADFSYEIYQHDKPLLLERILFNDEMMNAVYGMLGKCLYANMCVFPASDPELETARELAGNINYFGATRLGDLLFINALGDQTATIRQLFEKIWAALRSIVMDKAPCPPRIWAT